MENETVQVNPILQHPCQQEITSPPPQQPRNDMTECMWCVCCCYCILCLLGLEEY